MQEKIVLTYKDGVISFHGANTVGRVEISSKELKRMYWGKEGEGVLILEK